MQGLLNEALQITFRSLSKRWKHGEETNTAVQCNFFFL